MGGRYREQHLLRRYRGENLAKAAELNRCDNDGGKGGDVDQGILDHRDRGRRPQAAGISEGGENDESDDQRHVAGISGAGHAERADHDLQSHELKRDVRQRRHQAGHRDGERQPAIAKPAAHEIGRRDVVVLVADVPEPREHQKQDRIDQDGVRHREEGDRAGAEGQRRYRDESVGGVEIAADQKPGDEGAETPAAQPPFMQLVEIALAPARGGEPSQVMKTKRTTKTISAVQLTSCTTFPPPI